MRWLAVMMMSAMILGCGPEAEEGDVVAASAVGAWVDGTIAIDGAASHDGSAWEAGDITVDGLPSGSTGYLDTGARIHVCIESGDGEVCGELAVTVLIQSTTDRQSVTICANTVDRDPLGCTRYTIGQDEAETNDGVYGF